MLQFFTHPTCLEHLTGAHHPESPARLDTVLRVLDMDMFSALERISATRATRAAILRVHSEAHVACVLDQPVTTGQRQLDADTCMSPQSAEAALRAAGAAVGAVDAVMTGQASAAFCAIRPPGHHATRQAAMGFCLFNNVAVAAAEALTQYGLDRVAIVDFDVHHGNGTQDIFSNDPRVLYLSSHQGDFYPFTGLADEHGCGNVFNAPLAAGSGSREFRAAWETTLLPELERFAPQLLLISAGFDAHRLDPLANLNVETDDFVWLTGILHDLARRHAQGRIVSCLEGGYNLEALGVSAALHIYQLMQN